MYTLCFSNIWRTFGGRSAGYLGSRDAPVFMSQVKEKTLTSSRRTWGGVRTLSEIYFPLLIYYQRKINLQHIYCLVGIHTQESFNRWLGPYMMTKNCRKLASISWTHCRMVPTMPGTFYLLPLGWKTRSSQTLAWKSSVGHTNHLPCMIEVSAGVPLSHGSVWRAHSVSGNVHTVHLPDLSSQACEGRMGGCVNGGGFACSMYGSHNCGMGGYLKFGCGFSWENM